MVRALRIPELAQRDRFLRGALAGGRVFAVADGAELVRIESPRLPGRQVVLFWSARSDCQRWAPVLARDPHVVDLTLGQLVGRTLPEMAAADVAAGVDWTAEPLETEVAASDLANRLSLEALDAFATRALDSGMLWILETADGPALIGSADLPPPEAHLTTARIVLPVWTSRADAERHARHAPWTGATALPIPLESFLSLTVPWLIEQCWLVAAACGQVAHGVEFAPEPLAARLAPRRSAAE